MTKNIFTAVFMFLFLILNGCAPGSEQTEQTATDKVFTFGVPEELTTMDPLAHNNIPTAFIHRQIYNGLFRLTEKLEVVADLCQSYRIVDPLTWEFTLHQGIKFHNGEEMSAADAAFSLTRAFNAAISKNSFSLCESAIATDRYTLQIKTRKPYAPLLNRLAHYHSFIYPQKYFENVGENGLARQPIGAGPFMLAEWTSGDQLVLKRFDEYFGDTAKIEQLVIKIIPEPSAMSIALETGEIDATNDLPANALKRLEDNDQITVQIAESNSQDYIGFNTRKAPFSDLRLRRALSYAIDRRSVVDVVGEGYGSVAKGYFSRLMLGFDEFDEFSYDPEKAKQLLAAAGYSDLSFTLWSNDRKDRKDTAQLLQANFRAIGVEMNVEIMEWGTFLERLNRGDHDAYLVGSLSDGDPDGILNRLWHSTDVENGIVGSNRTFHNDPELDRLIEIGATTMEQDERQIVYRDINRQLVSLMPGIPIWWKSVNLCVNKRVRGIIVHPIRGYVFNTIDIDL